MAIAPNGFQNPEEMLNGLVLLLLITAFTYVLAWAAARTVARVGRPAARTRRRPAAPVIPPLSLVGLMFHDVSPALAQRHPTAPPFRRSGAASAPPWSATSGFPPPRSLVRTRASSPAGTSGDPTHDESHTRDGKAAGHPALHPGTRAGVVIPLFPRYGHTHSADDARARAMEQHPAGRRASCAGGTSSYVVKRGDTLWDIAAARLDTLDPARVARYWPRIHRMNRAAIGPDPSLILPGTVLELPRECE